MSLRAKRSQPKSPSNSSTCGESFFHRKPARNNEAEAEPYSDEHHRHHNPPAKDHPTAPCWILRLSLRARTRHRPHHHLRLAQIRSSIHRPSRSRPLNPGPNHRRRHRSAKSYFPNLRLPQFASAPRQLSSKCVSPQPNQKHFNRIQQKSTLSTTGELASKQPRSPRPDATHLAPATPGSSSNAAAEIHSGNQHTPQSRLQKDNIKMKERT